MAPAPIRGPAGTGGGSQPMRAAATGSVRRRGAGAKLPPLALRTGRVERRVRAAGARRAGLRLGGGK